MKHYLSTAVLVLFCGFKGALAQMPNAEWSQIIGGTEADEGYSIRQTSDGGYILTGVTVSFGAGSGDIYLVRMSSSGDTLWTSTFGGSEADWGECVNQTADGGFIIAGTTSSFSAGEKDICLIKTDDLGNQEWMVTYGGTDQDEAYALQQTSDGGFIITGFTNSFGAGDKDFYLIKTDGNGNPQWTRTFGGPAADIGAFVQETSDGCFIAAGSTRSYGEGGSDVYLIKTDPDGNTLWSTTFGGQSADAAYYAQETDEGGYIVAGYTQSFGAGGNDVYLIRTDSSGNSLWSRTFGGAGSDTGESVQQTGDGGFILAGFTNSYGAGAMDVYLVRTDQCGDTLWTGTMGGPQYDRCNSVATTSDGGFILGGLTLSYGGGSSDVYVIKLGAETGIDQFTDNPWISLELCSRNPFPSSLLISYSIPEQTGVNLSIIDTSGRIVERMVNGSAQPGTHMAEWVPSPETPAGCYLVRLEAAGCCLVEKCVKLN